MNHASDEALLEACLNGDQTAWSTLVARYKNLVYSVPVRYRLSPEDAADIFQQVWLALYSELPNLRRSGALRSWLLSVASHKCFHMKRQQGRTESGGEDFDRLATEYPPEWQRQAEREQSFRAAMAFVPPRCRELLRMLFYEDPPVPYSEAAARLGLAEGSIGFIRGRCLKKLREQLERRGF